jgi:topoisomerase-4 subunit A
VNKEEGFIGTALKKDDNGEFVCNCSDIDDIVVFLKNGKYKVVKVSEKQFIGKDIEHLAVYIRNDVRTIYNAVYRDGKNGVYYVKRFAVNGVTRDKEYDITTGKPDSKLMYFSANPNGEAETVKIQLKPTSRRIKKMAWDMDFSQIAIKGRGSRGNLLTKFPVSKIIFKQGGGSTLGGTHIWFDRDVLKLNTDQRGKYLGEFFNNDLILVINKNGDYCTTNFDLSNHYGEDFLKIEKFDAEKVWSVAMFDAEQQFFYIKRFKFEANFRNTSFIGDNPNSILNVISDEYFACFKVHFGGKDSKKEPLVVDAEQFISEKSFRAKGKRISTNQIDRIEEVEPLRQPEPEDSEPEEDSEPIEENTEIEQKEQKEQSEKTAINDVDEPSKPTLIYDRDNPATQGSLF